MTSGMDRGRLSKVTHAEIIDGLNELLELDVDAVAAYRVAIDKLEDRDRAMQISGYLQDHERHIRELREAITDLGGTPRNPSEEIGPLKEGLLKLGAIGGDRGLLMAWRTNELMVRATYDDYASKANEWPDRLKALIDRNALDEERHYRWVVEVLQSYGLDFTNGAEEGIVNRLRERREIRERLDGAREGAGEMLHGVTEKAREVAQRVAGSVEATTEYVRSQDVDRIREDVEDYIRIRPLRSVAVTLLAGFIVGRLLRRGDRW